VLDYFIANDIYDYSLQDVADATERSRNTVRKIIKEMLELKIIKPTTTTQMFGVRSICTIAVLLLALARNGLTLNEFKECLDGLIASGFWLSIDVYNKALEEAQSITKRKKMENSRSQVHEGVAFCCVSPALDV
jgi:hypothetical protein